MKKNILLLSVLLELCMACNDHKDVAPSSDVNQDKIYTSYRLEYDETTNETYASAQFFFNNNDGTSLKLSTLSAINFQGTSLEYSESILDFITGPHYLKRFSGYISSGTFVYTNDNSIVYKNQITITTIQPGALNTYSKSSSFNYVFDGPPIGSNESIELIINDINGKKGSIYNYTNTGNNILVGKTILDSLSIGTGSIKLSRSTTFPLTMSTYAGGRLGSRYATKSVPFTLN